MKTTKETKLISNTYDGPLKQYKSFEVEKVDLSYAFSDNVIEIDSGIKDTMQGIKLSILAMGIALYRIDKNGLFMELGHKKFGEYVDALGERTGMVRTTIFNWEYMGQAYMNHRSDLERVAFSESTGVTKLPYLERALQNRPKDEVYKNIVTMSYREFFDWSKGEIKKLEETDSETTYIKDRNVYAGTNFVASLSDNLSPEDKKYYGNWLIKAAKAKEENKYLSAFAFYDETEAKKFEKIYMREIKKMRSK